MKNIFLIAAFIASALFCGRPNAAIGDYLGSFSSPSGSPTGLTWDGAFLWSTDQVGAPDTVYKINPADGSVITSFSIPANTTQGLAWDGTDFYTSAGGTIYKFDITGALLDSHFFGVGIWGLEWNGSRLLAVNSLDQILTLNTSTWTADSTVAAGAGGLVGLTWDGSTLWAVQQATDTVFQLNAATGAIISSFTDAAAGNMFDITLDNVGDFWISDGSLNQIRHYAGPGASATPLSLGGWMGMATMISAMCLMTWLGRRRALSPEEDGAA